MPGERTARRISHDVDDHWPFTTNRRALGCLPFSIERSLTAYRATEIPNQRYFVDNNQIGQAAGTVCLKANVIWPWGLAALVIGAHIAGDRTLRDVGPHRGDNGACRTAGFLLGALAIVLPTVLSYASLNRHAPSAGAAASGMAGNRQPDDGFDRWTGDDDLLRDDGDHCAVAVRPFLPRLSGLGPCDDLPACGGLGDRFSVLQSALIAAICVRGAEVSIKTTIALMR